MGQVIQVKKARQDHRCEASIFVRENIRLLDLYPRLSPVERVALALAKLNEYRILENEPYIRYKYRDGIKLFEIRAIPAIHDICIKYKLYPDASV